MKLISRRLVICFNFGLSVTGLGQPVQRSFSPPFPPICVPAPQGLVGWWRAEGNALDVLGEHRGFLTNGAGYAAGKVGDGFLLDGKFMLTLDPTTQPGDLSNDQPLRIGNHANPNFNGFFKGIIDEVSLYDRALADAEIQLIYRAGSAGKCLRPNDGIPDSWREKFFGPNFDRDPRALAIADPDGDGANNYQEYLAGTNPLDRNSVVKVPFSVSTYAGSTEGTNNGFRTEAKFNTSIPDLAFDSGGRLWVAEGSVVGYDDPGPGFQRLRIIDPTGMVSTFSGTEAGLVDGPANIARFGGLRAVVFDSHGNPFVLDRYNNRIRKINANGIVSTFAGSVRGYRDGPPTIAQFNVPLGLCVDAADNFYLADFFNLTIRKISSTGVVSTFAGSIRGQQNGPRAVATFDSPADIACAKDGTLYVADWSNGMVRKIDTKGLVSTFASGLRYVDRVSLDSAGNVYASGGVGGIYKFSPDGKLVWSIKNPPGQQDGLVAEARFVYPSRVLETSDGNLLVTDVSQIRWITLRAPSLVKIQTSTTDSSAQASVTLTTVVPNAAIHFTLDQSEPTLDSPVYARPFSVTRPATIKARVFVNGIPVSDLFVETLAPHPTIVEQPKRTDFVQRTLPRTYSPGSKLGVLLKAIPPSDASVYAVEDAPPTGWVVGDITDGGSYDASRKEVKFGPFFDRLPRNLSYVVTPPAGEFGRKSFAGLASVDGESSPIGGDLELDSAPKHPCDRSPADFRISIDEVTAYGAAWRKGDQWPIEPNPIPIDFVTRAGALWKAGEDYVYNSSVPTAPLWWESPTGGTAHKLQQLRSTPPAPGRIVAESIMPHRFVPLEPFTVEISVTPTVAVTVYAVQDQVPVGWNVSGISQSGEFDPQTSQVKWGPFFDNAPRTLGYHVGSTQNRIDVADFQGMVSFDGMSIPISGQRQTQAAIRLSFLSRPSEGQFQLNVAGWPGESYLIETSTNLLNWAPLGILSNVNGGLRFNFPTVPTGSQQFYRVAPR